MFFNRQRKIVISGSNKIYTLHNAHIRGVLKSPVNGSPSRRVSCTHLKAIFNKFFHSHPSTSVVVLTNISCPMSSTSKYHRLFATLILCSPVFPNIGFRPSENFIKEQLVRFLAFFIKVHRPRDPMKTNSIRFTYEYVSDLSFNVRKTKGPILLFVNFQINIEKPMALLYVFEVFGFKMQSPKISGNCTVIGHFYGSESK
jgi:hypothetical protein